MKKIIIVILAICSIIITYCLGKQSAYTEDEELIEDLYNLSLHSDELLDMYYKHDCNFWLDVICESDSYQEYNKLQTKLNIE